MITYLVAEVKKLNQKFNEEIQKLNQEIQILNQEIQEIKRNSSL